MRNFHRTVQPELPRATRLSLSAVILAGGASRRMGRDKAWVEFEGRPLIQLAVDKVRALGVEEVFISGRAGEDYSALKCPVLFDLEPDFGPLGGIERGLSACTLPLLLVLAVDLPRMTTAFLQKLSARCDRLTGVVPRLMGEWEPLVAIYPKRCYAFAFEAITRSRRAVRDFAEASRRERAVRTFRVSAAEAGGFSNWNSPEDVSQGDEPSMTKHSCPTVMKSCKPDRRRAEDGPCPSAQPSAHHAARAGRRGKVCASRHSETNVLRRIQL